MSSNLTWGTKILKMKDDCFVIIKKNDNLKFHVGFIENFKNLLEEGDELVFGGTFLMYYPTREIRFDTDESNETFVHETINQLRPEIIEAITAYNLRWHYSNVDFSAYKFDYHCTCTRRSWDEPPKKLEFCKTQTWEEIISYLNIGRGERWDDRGSEHYKEPYTINDIHEGLPEVETLCHAITKTGVPVYPLAGYYVDKGYWVNCVVRDGKVHEEMISENINIVAFLPHDPKKYEELVEEKHRKEDGHED